MKAILSVASGVRSSRFNESLQVPELLVVDLFEVRDLADVGGVPAGLAEHVGADQPLHHDGKPGSEVIPDVTVAKEHSDQGNGVEEEEEPGSSYQDLDLPERYSSRLSSSPVTGSWKRLLTCISLVV